MRSLRDALPRHPLRPARGTLILAAVIAVQLLPIWLLPYFPSQDGPVHMTIARVLRDYGRPEAGVLRETFELNGEAVPNRFIYFVLADVLRFVSVPVAEKILLSAYVILLPLAVRWAIVGIAPLAPENAFLAVLALPFTFNFLLNMGFYNFSLSLVAFFFALGWWLRRRERFGPWDALVFAGLAVWVYFCHAVTLVALLAAAGASAGWLAVREGRVRQLAWLALASLPAAALTFSYAGDLGGYRAWLPFLDRLWGLATLNALVSVDSRIDLLAAFLAVALAGAAFRLLGRGREESGLRGCFESASRGDLTPPTPSPISRPPNPGRGGATTQSPENRRAGGSPSPGGGREGDGRGGQGVRSLCGAAGFSKHPLSGLGAAILVLIVLVLAAPQAMGVGNFITDRLILFPYLVLILWLASFEHSPRWRLGLQILGAGVALGMLGLLVPRWRDVNAYLAEAAPAMELVAPGSTYLPLTFSYAGEAPDGGPVVDRVLPFLHAGDHIAARTPVADLNLFAAGTDAFPIRYRPERNPFTHLQAGDGWMLTGGEADRIDYVLLWWPRASEPKLRATRRILMELQDGYDRIYTSPRDLVRLYRRKQVLTTGLAGVTPGAHVVTTGPDDVTPRGRVVTTGPIGLTPKGRVVTAGPVGVTPKGRVVTVGPVGVTPGGQILITEPIGLTPGAHVVTPEPIGVTG